MLIDTKQHYGESAQQIAIVQELTMLFPSYSNAYDGKAVPSRPKTVGREKQRNAFGTLGVLGPGDLGTWGVRGPGESGALGRAPGRAALGLWDLGTSRSAAALAAPPLNPPPSPTSPLGHLRPKRSLQVRAPLHCTRMPALNYNAIFFSGAPEKTILVQIAR